jgi:excisionase family DNA binding protein
VNEEELMTTAQVAETLGLTEQAVRLRLKRGHMAGRKVGRDWIVTRAEVERWRERGRMRAPRKPKQ